MTYLNEFSLIVLRPLIIAFALLQGAGASASVWIPTPEGFKTEVIHRAFSGTSKKVDWFRLSDSRLALNIFDFDNLDNYNRRIDRSYQYNLYKYAERAAEFSQTLAHFNQWLMKYGVNSLDESLKQGPVQVVIDPMVDFAETNAMFVYSSPLVPQQKWDWWINIFMEPIYDTDFQFGDTQVLIHELGHFLFHTSLQKITAPVVPERFVGFALGPVDEAFGDFVSYAFTGKPLVGKRWDYSEGRIIEFRRALSTTSADRTLVRAGNYEYKIKDGNDHVRGEPFRDVLIEISQDYGVKTAFDAMWAIQKKLTVPGSAIMSDVSTREEINIDFNKAIVEVFAAYPKRVKP